MAPGTPNYVHSKRGDTQHFFKRRPHASGAKMIKLEVERQNLLAAVAQQAREIVTLSDAVKQLRGNLTLAEEGLANYQQDNERLKVALERITECVEYRHPGCVQVIVGSGHEFWKAIAEAKQITHTHESSGVPQPA